MKNTILIRKKNLQQFKKDHILQESKHPKMQKNLIFLKQVTAIFCEILSADRKIFCLIERQKNILSAEDKLDFVSFHY